MMHIFKKANLAIILFSYVILISTSFAKSHSDVVDPCENIQGRWEGLSVQHIYDQICKYDMRMNVIRLDEKKILIQSYIWGQPHSGCSYAIPNKAWKGEGVCSRGMLMYNDRDDGFEGEIKGNSMSLNSINSLTSATLTKI